MVPSQLNLPKLFPDWVYSNSKIYFLYVLVKVLSIHNVFVVYSIKFLFKNLHCLYCFLFLASSFLMFFIYPVFKIGVHWDSTMLSCYTPGLGMSFVFLNSLNMKEHIGKHKKNCFCKCCFAIYINWQSGKTRERNITKFLWKFWTGFQTPHDWWPTHLNSHHQNFTPLSHFFRCCCWRYCSNVFKTYIKLQNQMYVARWISRQPA